MKHFRAIGHLALEPDIYLKQVRLKQAISYRMLLLTPASRIAKRYPKMLVCNESLADSWRSHFYVIKSPWIYFLLTRLKCWKRLNYSIDEYVMNYQQNSPIFRVNKEYSGPPTLQLKDEHLERGEEVLLKMGVPKDSWFVSFHSRAHDYAPVQKDSCFSHRNSDINTLFLGIEAVIQAGGWAIRMGHPNAPPLSTRFKQLPCVIDYTKSNDVCDWMDLFLASKCRFFIGGSTGISNLPAVLGKPCALVNMVPFGSFSYSPRDICIPKLYFSQKHHRLLRFPEILSLKSANAIHNSEMEDDKVIPIDNDEEEIRDLIIEMLKGLEGKMRYTKEQMELHRRFTDLFQPIHFSYGFASRAGISFLEKYQHLL